jgi:NADH dehydrogenase
MELVTGQSPKRKPVVILGGGFGGVYTAQCLLSCRERFRRPDIILVSRSPYFEFKPLFIEVLGNRLTPELARFRLKNIINSDAGSLKIATVQGIDGKRKVVATDRGEIQFDHLVIALGGGSVPVPMTRQATLFSLESVDECIRLRERVDELRQAARKSKGKLAKTQRTIAIIGAGPTGVEAAAEIANILRVDAGMESKHDIILIETAKHILPGWSRRLRRESAAILRKYKVDVRTGTGVKRVAKSRIYLDNGMTLSAGTIIWCGGLKGLPLYESIGAAIDKSGHLRVNAFLQLPGFERIFAMGDAISTKTFSAPVPQGAQAAYQQAKVVAHNILNATEEKRLRRFRYVELGEIVPVGGRRALAQVLGVPLSGHLAWMFEKGIHIQRVPGWLNKIRLFNGLVLDPLAQRGEEYLQRKGR